MNWNREDWELEREVMKALGWDVSCNLYTSGNERINRFFLVDPNGLEYVEIRGVPENTLDGAWKRHWIVCQNNYTQNLNDAYRLPLRDDYFLHLDRSAHGVNVASITKTNKKDAPILVEAISTSPCRAICVCWLEWRERK